MRGSNEGRILDRGARSEAVRCNCVEWATQNEIVRFTLLFTPSRSPHFLLSRHALLFLGHVVSSSAQTDTSRKLRLIRFKPDLSFVFLLRYESNQVQSSPGPIDNRSDTSSSPARTPSYFGRDSRGGRPSRQFGLLVSCFGSATTHR